MQEIGSHFLVMMAGMVLGKIIGQVDLAGRPVDFELVLLGSVTDPVKSHINRFGAILFDCTVDNTVGG